MNTQCLIPYQIKEDLKKLKQTKDDLNEHYSNLSLIKKILVEKGISLIGNSIISSINECISLMYSIEIHLLNYKAYFPLAQENDGVSSSQDIFHELESLRKFSETLYINSCQLLKQDKKKHFETNEIAISSI